MDFLKTLLLYMSLTIAGSVQGGPPVEDVPVPTPSPTPLVEASPAPEDDLPGLDVELPTQAPSETPVPQPTITPNLSYDNVAYGDKGSAVRKVQERLIELGYLPEGAADGLFGYQTYRAVRAFQQANGLNRDGVAGDATQTRLFEDPDVIPAATPEPTDTPEPPATDVPAGETAQPDDASLPTPVPVETPSEPPVGSAYGLTMVEGAYIALGDSGSHLVALRLTDGVMMPFYPRVWLNAEGEAFLSLRDMADSVTAWTLNENGGMLTLSAAGYTVSFAALGNSVTCAVDGAEAVLPEGSLFAVEGDMLVSETFLRQVFHAETLWDADENTLMLDVPAREEAVQND